MTLGFQIDPFSWTVRAVEVTDFDEHPIVGAKPWRGEDYFRPVPREEVFRTLSEAKSVLRERLARMADKIDALNWDEDLEKVVEKHDRRTASYKQALRDRRPR